MTAIGYENRDQTETSVTKKEPAIHLSDAQQAWLNKWGRWLDRAAELDREHEHTPGCRYEVYLNGDGDWMYSPMTQTAGAITVHSRAAAKILAAEMNAEEWA